VHGHASSYLNDLFVGTRIVDDRARVVSEVDDADFGQLRQIVQLVSDRRLLSVDDVFVGVWHFCGGKKGDCSITISRPRQHCIKTHDERGR